MITNASEHLSLSHFCIHFLWLYSPSFFLVHWATYISRCVNSHIINEREKYIMFKNATAVWNIRQQDNRHCLGLILGTCLLAVLVTLSVVLVDTWHRPLSKSTWITGSVVALWWFLTLPCKSNRFPCCVFIGAGPLGPWGLICTLYLPIFMISKTSLVRWSFPQLFSDLFPILFNLLFKSF